MTTTQTHDTPHKAQGTPHKAQGTPPTHFQLRAEMLADSPEFDHGKVLLAVNWKTSRFRGLENIDADSAEDLAQDFLLLNWKKRAEYDPEKGTRSDFAHGLFEGEAKNYGRRLKRDRFLYAASLDEPLEGGKPDSHELTHKDVVNAESELLPANYRGARQIRTTADLHFIHDMMGDGIDWRIFSLRWKYDLSNEDLARLLGWKIGKLRWHLKGYVRRYARLLNLRPHAVGAASCRTRFAPKPAPAVGRPR